MSKNCVVCHGKVDWALVREEFAELLDQADVHGVESLTEDQQVVYEGLCCSTNCYLSLNL